MKNATAVAGAVLVFFGSAFLWGVLAGFLPAFPRPSVPVLVPGQSGLVVSAEGRLLTDNVVGMLLALLAALGSYRATALRGRSPSSGDDTARADEDS